MLNVFEDTNLKNVPILIVFDKQNEDMQMINEKLRSLINLKDNLNINILHANFNQLETDMKLGLDWLCEVMKPIPE